MIHLSTYKYDFPTRFRLIRFHYFYTHVCMYGHTNSKKSMDQPGKVASPARGQLNRKN